AEATESAKVAFDEAGKARRSEAQAVQARRAAREGQWRSMLNEAQALSLTRWPGQRFAAPAKLPAALVLAREQGLTAADRLAFRNVALGCLTLPDVQELKVWKAFPDRAGWRWSWDFDAALATFAYSDGQGNVTVQRVAGGQPLATIPGKGTRQDVRLS